MRPTVNLNLKHPVCSMLRGEFLQWTQGSGPLVTLYISSNPLRVGKPAIPPSTVYCRFRGPPSAVCDLDSSIRYLLVDGVCLPHRLESPCYDHPPSIVHRSKKAAVSRGFTRCISDYFALTVIVFGRTSSALGRVMVKMPFSNSALALSATTAVGRMMLRSKAPQRCSRMW